MFTINEKRDGKSRKPKGPGSAYRSFEKRHRDAPRIVIFDLGVDIEAVKSAIVDVKTAATETVPTFIEMEPQPYKHNPRYSRPTSF